MPECIPVCLLVPVHFKTQENPQNGESMAYITESLLLHTVFLRKTLDSPHLLLCGNLQTRIAQHTDHCRTVFCKYIIQTLLFQQLIRGHPAITSPMKARRGYCSAPTLSAVMAFAEVHGACAAQPALHKGDLATNGKQTHLLTSISLLVWYRLGKGLAMSHM